MGILDVVSSVGGAIGGALDKVDMLPGLVEGACDMLGLPKEITGALKVVVGIVTEDYMCAADGGAELISSAAGDLSKSASESFDRPASSVNGYADSGTHCQPSVAPANCEASMATSPCGSTSGGASVHVGAAVGQADSTDTQGDAELQQLQVLLNNFDAIDRRYLPADSIGVGGLRDGHIDMDDLQSLSDATGTPPDVKRAVRYLMDHPDIYNKLARTDGAITTADLKILMEDRRAELGNQTSATSGGGCGGAGNTPGLPDKPGNTPPPGTVGGTTGSGSTCGTDGNTDATDPAAFASEIQSILADPSMSIEEKIQMILMKIEQQLDKELGSKMNQLAQKETDHVKMVKDGSTDEAAKEENKNSQDKLTMDIQQLVERRKDMFSLMSNIDSKFHDMSNTAIQNMGRA